MARAPNNLVTIGTLFSAEAASELISNAAKEIGSRRAKGLGGKRWFGETSEHSSLHAQVGRHSMAEA